MLIKDIYINISKSEGKNVNFFARVRSHRLGKNISFLIVNDGSTINDVQIVYKKDDNFFQEISQAKVGSIVSIDGTLKVTTEGKQPFEITANKLFLISNTNDNYKLQKKEHTYEFLRDIAHLRPRTKTFESVFRLRSSIFQCIHSFFTEKNFLFVTTPIITNNDAEGAGESFITTTITNNNYDNDFFGKKANLTVSGQLHAEAFAQAFQNVYTFGPTFRAEKSYTSKHAAEFWMLEPECANYELKQLMSLIEDIIKYIIKYILKHNIDELKYCDENLENGLIDKLHFIENSSFEVVEYSQAIEILSKAKDNGYNFEEKNIKFGLDLTTEHERYLCEKHFNKPTFVINYPKEIKAFYMRLNNDGRTVGAVDLLVPFIGELVGGSEREYDIDKIVKRCNELNINRDLLNWYIDLRSFGYYKTAGFGLGFERLIMYLTGMTNIRDVIPFPRTVRNLQF
ncbi:asparagine--tRNA ligase [Spiroplasma endosymbiont of Aspidapion aeneum]|uniref:asparagine--tRNA ligase n=1 Tax=Spiroplasma endosymbiont of Aspidapion aeneum TaxID=3066276 RepID=UPI00313E8E3A